MILHIPYGDRSVVVESKKNSRTEKTLFSIITPETFTFSQSDNWPKQVGDWSTSDKCLDYKQNSGKPNITILSAYSTCQWILPSRTTHGKKALLNHTLLPKMYKPNLPPHSKTLQSEQLYWSKQQKNFNRYHRASQWKALQTCDQVCLPECSPHVSSW